MVPPRELWEPRGKMGEKAFWESRIGGLLPEVEGLYTAQIQPQVSLQVAVLGGGKKQTNKQFLCIPKAAGS